MWFVIALYINFPLAVSIYKCMIPKDVYNKKKLLYNYLIFFAGFCKVNLDVFFA